MTGQLEQAVSLGVESEVGTLRKVIVHRPGLEHTRLTPTNADDLLFDDVIWVQQAIRDHAQAAMNTLENATDLTEEQDRQRGAIRGIFAAATSKADYAYHMHSQNPSREVHELIEDHLKVAIAQFFHLGQLAAMPQRADQPFLGAPPPPIIAQGLRFPLPGEAGFDAWCLTDSIARRAYERDRQAWSALETMWRLDPNPALTLAIKAEIDAAYTRGDITFAEDRSGNRLGYFFCCPWGSIYSVVRPVTLGGVSFVPLQRFVYDVTAEGAYRGVPFRRQVKAGNFQSTDEFEYGDPNEEPDH